MKKQLRLWNLLVATIMLVSALFGGKISQLVQADGSPIALSATSAYTQNFDGIGTTATAALPTGWGVIKVIDARTVSPFSGATFATAALGGNNLSTTAGNGVYNFGAGDAAAATDRAVGFLSSGSATKSGNLYARFNNGTGAALSAVTLSYNVEKYRNGSNASGFSMQLYYSLTGTTFTAAGAKFLTSFDADADNNGFASAPGATQSVTNKTLYVAIPSGSDFYLAWNYSVTSGTTTSNAQALSVDDVTILGIDTAATNPDGYGTANPKKVVSGEMSSLLSVIVTPGINPASSNLSVTCDLSAIGGSATQTLYDDATNGDVTSGDNTFSYFSAVSSSTTTGLKNLPCTIGDEQSRTSSLAIGLYALKVVPIGTVNGLISDTTEAPKHNADLKGQTVAIRGVIYEKAMQPNSFSPFAYYGFFIQNTTAQADADPNTSDGLYVFLNTTTTLPTTSGGTYTPTVGDEVTLSGLVTEYFNMTELTNPVLLQAVSRTGVDIDAEIPAFVANPPVSLADANRYWERRQAMRAQVPLNSQVISGRNVFSPPDGEIWFVHPDSTVAKRSDAFTNRAFRDSHPLDDNYDPANWDGNGYRMLMGSWGVKATLADPTLLINPGRTFDTVTNTPTGGINYSFSKYRIEVTTQPVFSNGLDPADNFGPQAVEPNLGYSISDYNLENLYDFRDNPFSGCDFTGNAGCPKVAPFLDAISTPFNYVPASDADYQARLNDIALQIINDLHSPDILMVQEVENQDICTVTAGALTCGTTDNADGKPDVLQELALKITGLGGPAYDAAFDRNSSDLRGIAPAFLYRTNRVQLLPPAGDPLLGVDPAIVYPGAAVPANSDVSNPKTLNAVLPAGVAACETSWVFPRAPDIGLFRVYRTSIGVGSYRDVYLVNNHFKSGPDSCVAARTEQTKYNAAIVSFLQASNPSARIVVGGDLNVYPRPDDIALGASDQLGSLYAPTLGLKNLWEVLVNQAPESAYSYVYIGMAQTLDQMFVNQPLLAELKQFRIAHINSDFPSEYTGDTARGTSDHDPMVAVFDWTPSVNAGGPYRVNQGADIQVSATGSDPGAEPVTFAWDLNNDGIFETTGQTVTYHAGFIPGEFTIAVKVTSETGLFKVASVNVFVNYRYLLPIINR